MKILVTSIVDLKKALHNRPHHFIKHLSRNHEITVLSISDHWKGGQFDADSYGKDFEHVLEKVSLKYLTNRRMSPVLQEVSSVVTLRDFFREVDCSTFDVHLNYNTLFSGYLVARRLRSFGINTVYDIADDLPQMIRLSPQIPRPLRPVAGLVGDRMVARNVGISRKVTLTTAALTRSCHVPKEKVEIVPNGVDTESFNSRPVDALKRKLGLEGKFVVGYAGALREWVDLESAFAALANLEGDCQGIRMLVVGQEGRFQENKDLAARLGVGDKVVFTGTVPYSEVPDYVSCMDVCLIPFKVNSITENAVPLKLFEYMGCHRPIIATRLYAIKEAVGDRVLYAGSQQEIRDNICLLYQDAALRSALGAQGREYVLENYGWSQICSKLEKLLEEVASSK